ncbi:MAG: hypothetical protein WCZ90_12550 [Melioribacteraceae bacterium]
MRHPSFAELGFEIFEQQMTGSELWIGEITTYDVRSWKWERSVN